MDKEQLLLGLVKNKVADKRKQIDEGTLEIDENLQEIVGKQQRSSEWHFTSNISLSALSTH